MLILLFKELKKGIFVIHFLGGGGGGGGGGKLK